MCQGAGETEPRRRSPSNLDTRGWGGNCTLESSLGGFAGTRCYIGSGGRRRERGVYMAAWATLQTVLFPEERRVEQRGPSGACSVRNARGMCQWDVGVR